jgi:hypothetical protein
MEHKSGEQAYALSTKIGEFCDENVQDEIVVILALARQLGLRIGAWGIDIGHRTRLYVISINSMRSALEEAFVQKFNKPPTKRPPLDLTGLE